MENKKKCVFRKSNSCIKCKNISLQDDSNYCKLHIKNYNINFNILNNFLGSKKNLELYDIYPLLVYIYSNNNNNDVNYETFINIIEYIYLNKYKVLTIINSDLCYYKKDSFLIKYNKQNVINYIHKLLYNTYLISIDKKKLNCVKKIQKNILKFLIKKLQINYDNEIPQNNEDPFTYDLITDIPNNIKFSYKDISGHLYTFNCIELDYFIKKMGAWNPYTKEVFSEDIINKLNKFINYNRFQRKSLENSYTWNTPLQAYTEVSQILEKIGFYNNVEWFMKISYNDIKNIIHRYKYITTGIENSNLYFNHSIRKQFYIYDFSKNIIELFKDGNDHYLLCCKFIKAISIYSDDFYNNLSPWLLYLDENIDTDYNIHDDNTIIIRPLTRNYITNIISNSTNNRTSNINTLLYPEQVNYMHNTTDVINNSNRNINTNIMTLVEQLNMIFNMLDSEE